MKNELIPRLIAAQEKFGTTNAAQGMGISYNGLREFISGKVPQQIRVKSGIEKFLNENGL